MFFTNLYLVISLISLTVSHIINYLKQTTSQVESRGIKRMIRDIKRMSGNIKRMSRDAKRMSRDIKRMSRDIKRMSRDIKRMSRDIKRMSRDIKRMSRDIKRMSRDIKRMSQVRLYQYSVHITPDQPIYNWFIKHFTLMSVCTYPIAE